MATKLVIVESPAKAKTIGGYLGKDYEVLASIGHIRDLLPNAKGLPDEIRKKWWADYAVDVENGFEPIYEVPSEKTAQVRKLKEAMKGKDTLVLATDEDREGESISWHLREVLKPKKDVKVIRIAFHEITKDAIQFAINNPREVDENLVQAQETRRVLDRLYGYTLSPVLWSRVERNLSAGRVQTPAVKIVVDREKERIAFKNAEYWDLRAVLKKESQDFSATLRQVDGVRVATGADFDDATGALKSAKEKRLILMGPEANSLAEVSKNSAPWMVTNLEEKEGQENPSPPFMTTTLQQDANRKFGYSADRTMRIAQTLYEGIDIGGSQTGLITYMRTDSLALSNDAISNIRKHIKSEYPDCLPEKPRTYVNKVRNAQEAHEAIRVSDASRRPADLRRHLNDDQFKIYDLIWKRTVACQMLPAKVLKTEATIEVKAGAKNLTFTANGKQILFDGFLKVYQESRDDSENEKEDDRRLPRLEKGKSVECKNVTAEEHKTLPPARYTEATLIKKLEENGIGRPSTYASILSVIVDRGYVRKAGKALIPTFTAFMTMDVLEGNFNEFTQLEFTRTMDEALDDIAEGKADSKKYLGEFFLGDEGLKTVVDERKKEMPYPIFRLGESPETHEEIFVRLGKSGEPFLQLGPRENKKYANVPEGIAPADLTVEMALKLLSEKGADAESVGFDPVTGRKLLLRNRQGYYLEVERTEEEIERKDKPRWISVPPGVDPRDLSQEKLEFLCNLPLRIGANPDTGEVIEFKIGKFGAYVSCGKESRTLPNWEEGIGLKVEKALEILATPRTGRVRGVAAPPLKEFVIDGDSPVHIKVLSGRFGNYITDGEINATLPRGTTVEDLSQEMALELLQKKRDAGPSVRPTKSKGRKSATTFKKKATVSKTSSASTTPKVAAKKTTAKKPTVKKTAAKKAAVKRAPKK